MSWLLMSFHVLPARQSGNQQAGSQTVPYGVQYSQSGGQNNFEKLCWFPACLRFLAVSLSLSPWDCGCRVIPSLAAVLAFRQNNSQVYSPLPKRS